MKDWYTRIIEAREWGEFTEGENELASDWPTCACGEQDDRIERDDAGEPLDSYLSALGALFLRTVADNNFDEAELVLTQIEKRSEELIKEQEINQ